MDNSEDTDPHCSFDDLLIKSSGIIVLSGSIRCLIGDLFNKGLFSEIEEIISKLSKVFKDNFYIEIQRHKDLNEKEFESFNLNISKKYNLPIVATNEVYYLDKNMFEAHDALMCIGEKAYVNDPNRLKLSDQHYFKSSEEMNELFSDLPEALENNYNLPYRCSFKPQVSKPILPSISSKDINTNELLVKDSYDGLKEKFSKYFEIDKKELEKNNDYHLYKQRLEHE